MKKIILSILLSAIFLVSFGWGIEPVGIYQLATTISVQVRIDSPVIDAIPEDGGAIVVWQDSRCNKSSIYAQKVNNDLTFAWSPSGKLISTATVADQLIPRILADGQGGGIISWISDDLGRGGSFAQRILPDGQLAWLSNVIDSTNMVKTPPAVMSMDDKGVFYWISQQNNDYFLNLKSFKLDNSDKIWEVKNKIKGFDFGSNFMPQPIVKNDNNINVGWFNPPVGLTAAMDINVQSFDSSGKSNWPVIENITGSTVNWGKIMPQMVAGNSGDFFVISDEYQDGNTNGHGNVFINHISVNGEILWSLNADSVSQRQYLEIHNNVCQAYSDGCGGLVMPWYEKDSTGWSIYAQRIDSNGNMLWDAGGIRIARGVEKLRYPQALVSGNKVIIVFRSEGSQFNSIWGAVVDLTTGNSLESPIELARAINPTSPTVPIIKVSSSGQLLIVWIGSEAVVPTREGLALLEAKLLKNSSSKSESNFKLLGMKAVLKGTTFVESWQLYQ